MNTAERFWSPQSEAKILWQRVSTAAFPAVAVSLLAVIFPAYIGRIFVLLAAFVSTLLLCFPLEPPQLSLAGVPEPGWWNVRLANGE